MLSVRNCRRLVFILIWMFSHQFQVLAQDKKQHALSVKSTKNLKEFFQYTPDRIPLICGHRGGAQELYPENSIAGLEYILNKMPAFFEIDPRLTKDSVAVVLHDATLDRTTNGKGKLSDYTWEEIKKLRLKDSKGKLTNYAIHTLDEVLQWAKGKTIIMIDKKDVPLGQLYEIIKRNKAESCVLISAYEPEEAAFYYAKDKNLMFEIFVSNEEKLKAYEDTGVPYENMVAYVGQPKKKSFYELLHSKGMMIFVYTAKVMEREKNKDTRVELYRKTIRDGADILLSDRALEAYGAIEQFMPEKSTKSKFFKTSKP
ncbi:MAG: glycerophosphodiester phosphodiesterase family protein [Pedobacter sp.]|uniref:glycerophosphodiester phosphodiesterase family protein n=1 Tax=Pedobacter sp. TaxID=1411316 RepID=UPI002807FD24|nr:glycerophosphodiester phosphodiesterase family protein [Pedobacter sp.]MDQ8005538.1 glycerophosphodiester phosphodiesterase family protein [Pedobacter sp.]